MTGNGTDTTGSKLSLAMIVRNCAGDLDRALQSIRRYVDEAVIVDTEPGGSTDGTREVAKMHNCRLLDFPWIDDFSAARNFATQNCSYDAVMWLDSDDIVEHPLELTKTARGLMLTQLDCLYVRYDYEWDASGHCTTRLWRERVTDRTRFSWKAPIHECQCAAYRYEAAHVQPESGTIRHTRKREDVESARVRLERNLHHLEAAAKNGQMETRLLFYWGNTLVGLGRQAEAIEKYAQYIQHSGVPEEKYAAMMAVSECHRVLHDYRSALQAIMQAVCFRPDLCSAYVHAAETYLATLNYNEAERWAREALNHRSGADNEIVYNPKAIDGRPHVILSIAAAQQGRLEEAKVHMEKAERFYPDDAHVLEIKGQIQEAHRRQVLLHSFGNLVSQASEEGHRDRIESLAAIVPDYIRDEGFVQAHTARPRVAEQPTIAFYCPVQGEKWNPHAIKRGIGGSEEAVINMARCFTTLGWNVEVYAETEAPGDYAPYGRWYPLQAFKGESDQIDVAVWWRCPDGPINAGMSARCSYIWLHDTPVGAQWIPNYSDMVDRVFFLSNYHRTLFPWVKDEHAYVTRNGTDPALWTEPRNEPGRLIYSSCPSRGLVRLLDWWAVIREKVPHATLDVFYGWNVWAIQRANSDLVFGDTYRRVEEMKDQPGVTWHGRVGQAELADAMARSQIWAYPCEFPEISCITAMKMQQHGVMPITIGKRNALEETVRYGEKLDLELSGVVGQKLFIDRVIHHLQHPDEFAPQRGEMIAWARDNYRWVSVAEDWDRLMRADLAKKEASAAIKVRKGRSPRRLAASSTS